jgi:hypothetical protein
MPFPNLIVIQMSQADAVYSAHVPSNEGLLKGMNIIVHCRYRKSDNPSAFHWWIQAGEKTHTIQHQQHEHRKFHFTLHFFLLIYNSLVVLDDCTVSGQMKKRNISHYSEARRFGQVFSDVMKRGLFA